MLVLKEMLVQTVTLLAVVVINEGNSGGDDDDTLMVIDVESFSAFNSLVAALQTVSKSNIPSFPCLGCQMGCILDRRPFGYQCISGSAPSRDVSGA